MFFIFTYTQQSMSLNYCKCDRKQLNTKKKIFILTAMHVGDFRQCCFIARVNSKFICQSSFDPLNIPIDHLEDHCLNNKLVYLHSATIKHHALERRSTHFGKNNKNLIFASVQGNYCLNFQINHVIYTHIGIKNYFILSLRLL